MEVDEVGLADVLQGNLYGYKGAIFEGIMADCLHKKGQGLYYHLKDSGLELDFLIKQKGECVPDGRAGRDACGAQAVATGTEPDDRRVSAL